MHMLFTTRIARISFHNRLVGKHLKTCLKLSMMNSFTNVNKTFYRRTMSNLPTETDGNTDTSGNSSNSSYIKNVYKDLDDRCLKVAWSDGTASRFPYNYLRDNCTCPKCFESSSKQKLFNTARDLMMDIQIEEAVISEDGRYLKCIWPGGHESSYSLHLLHNMRMPEKNELRQRNSDGLVKDELILWNREMMQDKIPFHDYNVLMSEDKSLFDLLYCLYQHGIVVIDNAPKRDGVLLELAARVGYHKRTHYGEIFDVKDIENPSNLAYTNHHLPFHMDQPYYKSILNIQLLHCIHENTSGGNSIFVDGFHVAKQVYENHPDVFDVLKTFYVRFVDFGADAYGKFTFGYSHPIINVNRHGRINSFVYSASAESDSKGDCTPDELLAFYDASYVLMKGLHDPNNVIDIHLKSGQIAMFHNDRVLHGRTAFESTAEKPMARWLQGMYFDWDVVFSKLQVLQMKLGLKTPYLPEQSDDYF